MKKNFKEIIRFFKRNKAFTKCLSFMLSLTLLFYVIPSTIYAKVANAIETNENAYDNTVIVTDSSSGTDDITTENVLDGILY